MSDVSGAPQVRPSTMPQRISGLSASLRCVVMRFCSGALLAMKASSSTASTASPAGSPSIVTPMAAAWLWPKTAVRMFLPK